MKWYGALELSNAQRERLAILAEELAEAAQIISKIQRFGYNDGWEGETNRQRLERELGDILETLELMFRCKDINRDSVCLAQLRKLKKLKVWTQFQDW